SAEAFRGPPGSNVSDAVFAVLRNVHGNASSFVTFENVPRPLADGSIIGGSRTLDFPNIAIGDLTGDGYPEVFIQGRHKSGRGDGLDVMDSRLFYNSSGTSFEELAVPLPDVGEGGQAIADFNNDGRLDLVYTGATYPYAYPNDPNT